MSAVGIAAAEVAQMHAEAGKLLDAIPPMARMVAPELVKRAEALRDRLAALAEYLNQDSA